LNQLAAAQTSCPAPPIKAVAVSESSEQSAESVILLRHRCDTARFRSPQRLPRINVADTTESLTTAHRCRHA
jgi:hypothetical protein